MSCSAPLVVVTVNAPATTFSPMTAFKQGTFTIIAGDSDYEDMVRAQN